MKNVFLILFLLQTASYLQGQVYIAPYTGLQVDLNNTNPHFKQVNSGLQFSFKSRGSYELVLQLQHSWPMASHSSDSGFTANPLLPVYVSVAKKILPSSSSFALMHRFAVAGRHSAGTLYISFSTGLVYQKMKVSYAYDKTNYSILNPDKTQDIANIYGGFGISYMRQWKKGRFFAGLDFNTPPAGGKIKYPSSFKFMAPAALNFGYAFKITKK